MSLKFCYVIGEPIQHSLSPQIHTAGYTALKLNDEFRFLPLCVLPEHLRETVIGFKSMNVRGISVTLPHKTTVMEFVDRLDPLAEKAGAVNTIVNDDGRFTGFNTDIDGVKAPLLARTQLKRKKAAVIGAGGAARAALAALSDEGAEVTVFNRTRKTGESLSNDFGASYQPLDAHTDLLPFDIIIQSTPVGMSPSVEDSPVSSTLLTNSFRSGQFVFDMIYNPLRTKFLDAAAKAGATTIDGTEMFISQAASQFKLYTGHDAPISEMKTALLEALSSRE